METLKKKSFAELLTPEEQMKVLENVINKGLFDQIVPLAQEGYAFSVFIFDLLRTCGKTDILEQIWDMNFSFKGHLKQLLFFIVRYKGEENAARFIAKHREDSSIWDTCYCYLPDSMLEVVQDWKALVSRGNLDALMRHERFDDIINNFSRFSSNSKAARALKEHGLMQRIVQLKQYDWLLTPEWQPEGARYLVENGEAMLVIRHFSCLTVTAKVIKEIICASPENRELLRRRGLYEWLFDAGYPEYLAEDGKWQMLADHRRFDLIDWSKVDSKFDRQRIVAMAVRNNRWDFLLKNRQYKVLLKHGKIKLLLGL